MEGGQGPLNRCDWAVVNITMLKVEAIESGQGGRVEALMREHAFGVKESLNLTAFHVSMGDAVARVALVR